jgi:Protein of unknown function (DUF3179)
MNEDLEINSPSTEPAEEPAPLRPRRSRGPWKPVLFTAAFALIGFACFAYPMFVIRPFRHQGPTELAIALAVKQAATVITILCAVSATFALGAFWHRISIPKRVLATVFALVACGSVWLARFNVYEIMFHPMGTPAVEPAQTAKIDPDDMVLAVNVNSSARAYPIRTMGYHHIANDWVGGEPIVATY